MPSIGWFADVFESLLPMIDRNLAMFSYYYCVSMLTLVSIDSMMRRIQHWRKMQSVNHLATHMDEIIHYRCYCLVKRPPCDTIDGDTHRLAITCPTNSTVNHVTTINMDENWMVLAMTMWLNDNDYYSIVPAPDLGYLYQAIVHFDHDNVLVS